jgi:hypothetical protein
MEENEIIIFSNSVGKLLIGKKITEDENAVVVQQPHFIEADISNGADGKPRQSLKYVPTSYLELFELNSEHLWAYAKNTHNFNANKPSKEAIALYDQLIEAYDRILEQHTKSESSEIRLED